MDKSIERLQRNIQKLDEMISEHEKRISVLQDSRLLMTKQISAIKYHGKVVKMRSKLNMDDIINKARNMMRNK